jgi:glucose/arabinose dehydrogenase
MKQLAIAGLLALTAASAGAQVNMGTQKSDDNLPFTITQVASFNLPWKIAFLPDGRMLINEKIGQLSLVTQKGEKTPVSGVPKVEYKGQEGLLGVFLAPTYAKDHVVYLTYSEPEDGVKGSSLAVAKATLKLDASSASLENLKVIWHDGERGEGGQVGGIIAFAPDGKSFFLSSGDRQRFTPAQDPNQPLGKMLHLTLDGKPAPDNPWAGKTGAQTVNVIDPPKDTETAKTAPTVRTYTFPGPNLTPAETWSSGHRTPYGLAFAPNGELWELEHGPKGGDELNLIKKGKNYGWPLVSYATNYDDVPIASPDTRADLEKPVIYWTPVIAPGSLTFYHGKKAFPQFDGSALIGGMASMAILHVTFDGHGGAKVNERWGVGKRVRDIAEAPDGTLWMIEDNRGGPTGGLFHITPK